VCCCWTRAGKIRPRKLFPKFLSPGSLFPLQWRFFDLLLNFGAKKAFLSEASRKCVFLSFFLPPPRYDKPKTSIVPSRGPVFFFSVYPGKVLVNFSPWLFFGPLLNITSDLTEIRCVTFFFPFPDSFSFCVFRRSFRQRSFASQTEGGYRIACYPIPFPRIRRTPPLAPLCPYNFFCLKESPRLSPYTSTRLHWSGGSPCFEPYSTFLLFFPFLWKFLFLCRL